MQAHAFVKTSAFPDQLADWVASGLPQEAFAVPLSNQLVLTKIIRESFDEQLALRKMTYNNPKVRSGLLLPTWML